MGKGGKSRERGGGGGKKGKRARGKGGECGGGAADPVVNETPLL